MNYLKVNRKYFIDPKNIKKILIKNVNGLDEPWIYVKQGYPSILKATEGLQVLKNRLVNLGYTIYDFDIEVK